MAEGGDEIAVTYETLFELLRKEKSSEELQRLDSDFYKRLKDYIAEKSQSRLNSLLSNNIFSEIERERIERQLYNTKRLVKELFERREKKIVAMALNRSRIGKAIIDTSALLDSEKRFFESLVNVFNAARQDILLNILSAGSVESTGEKESNDRESPELRKVAERTDNGSEAKELKRDTEHQDSANKLEQSDKKEQYMAVRMLCNVQQFVGPNLEICGPFEENEIVRLPEIVCNALVNTGKAVLVENEDSKNSNEVLSLL